MEETTVIVVYDIENDAIRNKVAEACKDYGLERVQYSCFMGMLNRNMRSELFLKLKELLGERPGKIIVMPICASDMALKKDVVNISEEEYSSEQEHRKATGTH